MIVPFVSYTVVRIFIGIVLIFASHLPNSRSSACYEKKDLAANY